VLVLITILSVLAAALRQTYLHPGFFSALLCVTAAMALYEAGVFGFCLLLGHATFDRYISFCVPAVLSLAALPFVYPIAKAISAIGGETWKE
jgi:cell shape-determining protein MreD